MKIRLATKEDKGPYLSGIIECDHITPSGMGPIRSNQEHCTVCKGTGWKTVPVVIDNVPD